MFWNLSRNKEHRCHPRLWAALLAAAVFLTCCGKTTVQAAADRQQEEAVEEFVKSYYEALTEGDIDVIWEYLQDDELDQMHHQAMAEILAKYGTQVCDIQTVKIQSLEENNWWLVTVVYDLLIEGIDSPLPGLENLVIQMFEDGSGLIIFDMDSSMADEVSQFLESEEIRDMILEVDRRFSDIIREHPEIGDRLLEIQQAATLRVAELISGEDASEEPEESGVFEEFYVVRQGDCLWHIAEEWLGDGARWVELYEINRDTIGDDPNLILIGMELQIP